MSGFFGVGSGFQVGFLEEIAPALVAILRALSIFQFSDGCLCVLPALDDLDDSCGPVGPNVVANYDVGSIRFVACQRETPFAKGKS